MNIPDMKAIAADYFEAQAKIKDIKEFRQKHEEQKIRDFAERDKIMAERKETSAIHDEQRALNKLARQKEVDEKMQFLKQGMALNII